MHGRPRRAETPKQKKDSSVRGAKLRSLQNQFMEFHHNKIYTKEAMDLSARLVEMNPEYYTAWNYRKLALEHLLKDEFDSESIEFIMDEELQVVKNALDRNSKSYGAWHHRKWLLRKDHSLAKNELSFLNEFQNEDRRNFHAWNYRRFITSLMNIPVEDELKYTETMINDNFGNYWRNLNVYLSPLLNKEIAGYHSKETFLKECKRVWDALFMAPEDQSSWFYYFWFLDQIGKVEHLFLSSWPPNGSKICAPGHDVVLNQYAFQPGSSLHFEDFPIILYFSEGVGGVNSNTVTVDCEFASNTNLVWRSIAANKSGFASTWFTCLHFPIKDMIPYKHYLVKVRVAHSGGIVSSSGDCCSHPFPIEFGVCVSSHSSELGKKKESQRIFWSDENFHAIEWYSKEFYFANGFCPIKINADCEMEMNKMNAEIIAEEISYSRALAETECKIGKLSLARLLIAYDKLSSASSNAFHQSMLPYEEILELYNNLMEMDPSHVHYYKDEHSLVFLKQVLTNKESLLQRCCQYRDSSSPQNGRFASLRLHGLSLTRMGCVERLLWVQLLDLRENELQSIEGLEAMQLLCCLNISRNKFSSFSSLAPLRLLKSLQVLDISHNQIGTHSIDTRRYLCASPLSHTVGSDWKKTEQFGLDELEMSTYWNAFLFFKDLNLVQLDIIGNPVVDDKFMSILCKLLPTMKWLDGEKLE